MEPWEATRRWAAGRQIIHSRFDGGADLDQFPLEIGRMANDFADGRLDWSRAAGLGEG